ncbi:hypothetical protein SUNI508_09040 [Seiridium unicorne]|uniref:Uncharacterized protein n=1 Tax=Seiridium unicorne TaxID=138068 RepID=A0ABR2USE6_9PEZI
MQRDLPWPRSMKQFLPAGASASKRRLLNPEDARTVSRATNPRRYFRKILARVMPRSHVDVKAMLDVLGHIQPGMQPSNSGPYEQVRSLLLQAIKAGHAKGWDDKADIKVDLPSQQHLEALAIYGDSRGFGNLPDPILSLLRNSGLYFLFVAPDKRIVPSCWAKTIQRAGWELGQHYVRTASKVVSLPLPGFGDDVATTPGAAASQGFTWPPLPPPPRVGMMEAQKKQMDNLGRPPIQADIPVRANYLPPPRFSLPPLSIDLEAQVNNITNNVSKRFRELEPMVTAEVAKAFEEADHRIQELEIKSQIDRAQICRLTMENDDFAERLYRVEQFLAVQEGEIAFPRALGAPTGTKPRAQLPKRPAKVQNPKAFGRTANWTLFDPKPTGDPSWEEFADMDEEEEPQAQKRRWVK